MTTKSAKAAADYPVGHVKHDPKTGSVAIRTVFSGDQFPNMTWLVATTGMGAQNAGDRDVIEWEDIYTPPAVEAQAEPVQPVQPVALTDSAVTEQGSQTK